jgi:hypothetical protein
LLAVPTSKSKPQLVIARGLGIGGAKKIADAEKLSFDAGRMLVVLMRRLI